MRNMVLELSHVSTDFQQGHIVTLEITSGEVYRGKLIEGPIPTLSITLKPC